jgi:hypothetical protein
MSLPNSLALPKKPKIVGEKAQSNTMVCKGNMKFRVEAKKLQEAQAAPPGEG